MEPAEIAPVPNSNGLNIQPAVEGENVPESADPVVPALEGESTPAPVPDKNASQNGILVNPGAFVIK